MFIATAQAAETELNTEIGVPGEAVASPTFPPFDGSTVGSQLLWLVLTFGVLYLVMSKIALPRLSDILEVRHDRIQGDLAKAERLRQQTDRAITSYEEALATARQNAHEIAQESRDKIQADIQAQKDKVEAELSEKMQAAEDQITKAQSDALSHIDDIAAGTAEHIVHELVGKVSKADFEGAVKASLKGVQNG